MQDYFKQKKSGKNPVFKAKDINLETKTDFWNWYFKEYVKNRIVAVHSVEQSEGIGQLKK